MMCRRSHFTATCLIVFGTLFPTRNLHAEVPNQSVESLKKNASHIVVGKVTVIRDRTINSGDYEETESTAEITVATVEKGDGISTGDGIQAQYWRKRWIGKGSPPPGSNGHRGIPKKNDKVRVYLTKVKGRGYDVQFPNGFEVIKAEEK